MNNIFGYAYKVSIAKTIWVHNQPHENLGSREDYMFKLSRLYVRDIKTYMWTLIIWKFSLRWAKI